MKFKSDILSMIVKPEGEAIFAETATIIRIEDEAAGPFIVIEQHYDSYGKIAIGPDEWPTIKETIEKLLEVCKKFEKEDKNASI